MTQPAPINLTAFPIGSWVFSPAHGDSVRILDVETVWNHTVYQVWIPRLATVERVPAASLAPAQPTTDGGFCNALLCDVCRSRLCDIAGLSLSNDGPQDAARAAGLEEQARCTCGCDGLDGMAYGVGFMTEHELSVVRDHVKRLLLSCAPEITDVTSKNIVDNTILRLRQELNLPTKTGEIKP